MGKCIESEGSDNKKIPGNANVYVGTDGGNGIEDADREGMVREVGRNPRECCVPLSKEGRLQQGGGGLVLMQQKSSRKVKTKESPLDLAIWSLVPLVTTVALECLGTLQ